jgi:DNA-binding transcriptional MerR regulator
MFTIGEFSKASGLSIKTLRFYHEEGLLVPTSIDDATGYRYYDGSLVELARTIAFLKSLEFSLAEIREILGGQRDEAALVAALERQRQVIDERIRRLKQVAKSLDQFLHEQREGKTLMTTAEFQCEEKVLPTMKIAALRMHAPYSECGKGFSQLGRVFWSKSNGPPMMLCHDGEYQEIGNYETCFPVKSGQSTGQIDVRDLPGGRARDRLRSARPARRPLRVALAQGPIRADQPLVCQGDGLRQGEGLPAPGAIPRGVPQGAGDDLSGESEKLPNGDSAHG